MKKSITKISIALLLLLTVQLTKAQTTGFSGINYQAVAIDEKGKEIAGMDNAGQPLIGKEIAVRFSILNAGQNGAMLYQETHVTNTDAYGLFSLVIGQGTVTTASPTNSLSAITWSTAIHFLKVELDINHSGDFKLMSNQQFMAVPYAFFALNTPNGGVGSQGPQGIQGVAGNNGLNGINTIVKTTTEASGVNCATGGFKTEYGLDANNNGTLDASEVVAALTQYVCNGNIGVTGSNGTNGNHSLINLSSEPTSTNCATGGVKVETGLDANNDGVLQTTEINNALTKYVCNGTVGATGPASSQSLSVTGNIISISGGNAITLPVGSDTQTLSLNSNTLNIANGNAVVLPISPTYTNGTGIAITSGSIINTAPNQTVNISGAGVTGTYPNYTVSAGTASTTVLNAGANITIGGSAPNYTVSSPSQSLSLNSNTLNISGGNNVVLPVSTDTQTLSLNSNTLSINNGNSVILPISTDSQTLSVAGRTLAIANGNAITIPSQSLTISSNSISISNGNTIVLPSCSDTQTLSISGNTISIANGNTITIPAYPTYTNGSGIAITSGSVITNIAPNQTVTLSGTGAATVTGTYPNYTINAPANTDAQALSLNSNSLSISNGNTITIPTYTNGVGISIITTTGSIGSIITNSAPNQTVNISGTGVTGTYPNYTVSAGTASTTVLNAGTNITIGGSAPSYTVSSPSQSLSLNSNTLSISGGNNVVLPISSDSQTLAITGRTVSIANGNDISLPVDNDAQTLTVNNNSITISNGNTIALLTGTDSQILSLNSNTLSINNGNSVVLPLGGSVPSGTVAGQMLYWNGTAWVTVAPGVTGQNLTFCNGVPTWGPCPSGLPIIITETISLIMSSSAVSGGTVTNDGGSLVTSRGVCWSLTSNPTITNSITTDGAGVGAFISNLGSLTPNTTYYIRAYATNSNGTAYGNELTFDTQIASLPTITTAIASSITNSTSVSGGTITSDGGSLITARGVCWSTSINPTTSNSITSDGSGIGLFISNLSGLIANTTYYVRAYATNSFGTAYGNQISFKTLGLATITTNAISSITDISATGGGNVTNDGGTAVTAKGICWNTSINPTTANSITIDGTGTGSFLSYLIGLNPNTTYYVRAYATNSIGTSYGNQVTFKTTTLPTLLTSVASLITTNSAICGGTITSDGGALVSARGICWSTTTNPTTANNITSNGSGIGTFTSSLTGLGSNITYYVRAYAVNSVGTAYGNQISFTTPVPTLPTVTTTPITLITNSTSTSGGNVINDGGSSVTTRGVCWSTSPSPTTANNITTDGTGTGSFSSNITLLVPNTVYYIRSYATNGVGTAYGAQYTFTTSPPVVGSNYQGGIVAYIFSSTDPGYVSGQTHGLIASTSDVGTNVPWWNGSTYVTTDATTTSNAFGSGNANTNTVFGIPNAVGANANSLCYNLSLNGYTDWYLPSFAELNKLYLNKTIIGGFSASYYWSSSKTGTGNAAWLQYFFDGTQLTNNYTFGFNARAIRTF